MQRVRQYPTRVLQFGQGNFLRCFVDWQLDILNEKTNLNAGIVILRPTNRSRRPFLNIQDGLYTTIIRGINEKNEAVEEFRQIQSVNKEMSIYQQYDEYLAEVKNPELRYIFSNTTEAGIVFSADDKLTDTPPQSFPAKLTQLLYERFKALPDKTLVIVPCELIDDNGAVLKKVVLEYAKLWQLEEAFFSYIEAQTWCDTLVDRIVPGFPTDERAEFEKKLGYKDDFMVVGEYFHLFVIKGPAWLADELKLKDSGLNIIVTDNIKAYKQRKVGILNGGHSLMVAIAYLSGLRTVREAVEDDQVGVFLERTLTEAVIPVIPLPEEELLAYKASTFNRFKNPYVKHMLISITLNHMSKFKERVWYGAIEPYFKKTGKWPLFPLVSLAAAIVFYKGSFNGEEIPLADDAYILETFKTAWGAFDGSNYQSVVEAVLALENLWGKDLSQETEVVKIVSSYAEAIDTKGMRAVLTEILA